MSRVLADKLNTAVGCTGMRFEREPRRQAFDDSVRAVHSEHLSARFVSGNGHNPGEGAVVARLRAVKDVLARAEPA